jgi:predicted AAA+ superfamily ATPase
MTTPPLPHELLTLAQHCLQHWLQQQPAPIAAPNWEENVAWRWRRQGQRGYLQPVTTLPAVTLDNLVNIDTQKQRLWQNTAQFVAGRTANNVLLTGARGTGKSSIVKALLPAFAAQGLRMIEIDKDHLTDLPDVIDLIANRPERFVIFCDDLSFEQGDYGYKALKVALDGSLAAPSANMLIYATSNRRHLLPDHFADNNTAVESGEIHPGEAVDDKIALSERFGLWLSFYAFDQNDYLRATEQWVTQLGGQWQPQTRTAALQWAHSRGARSGRVAQQFARDWQGAQHD